MKKLTIRYQQDDRFVWSPTTVYHKLFNKLKDHYGDIEFEHIQSDNTHFREFGNVFEFIITNEENGKHIIITYADQARFVLSKEEAFGYDPEKMQQFFFCNDWNVLSGAHEIFYETNTPPTIFGVNIINNH